MSKTRTILRLISAILIHTFILNEAVFAAPELQTLNISFAKPFALGMNIPHSVALVEDTWKVPGNDKIIFLLQDAHTNESGQANIAKALDLILQKEKVKYVFLEAGTGDDSLSYLREKAPLERRQQVANSYLKKGELSGAEFLDLTSEHKFILWGAEDKTLYYKSIECYKVIVDQREKFKNYLNQIETTTDTLKSRLFNLSLFTFDEKHEAFLKEKISLTDYFSVLSKEADKIGISLSSYSHIRSLKKIKEEEARIDFEKANQEQQKALASLTPEVMKELLEASQDAKYEIFKLSGQNHTAAKAYYALLEEKIREEVRSSEVGARKIYSEPRTPNSELKYPNLFRYFDYLKEVRKIDPKKLFDEQRLLESEIYRVLAKTTDEAELSRISQNLKSLKLLLDLTLTPDEFHRYAADPRTFDVAYITGFLNRKIMDLRNNYERAVFLEKGYEDVFQKAREFYELTYQRDEAFVRNALKKMDKENETKAVLITGGYHSPNLKEILKKNNISFICLTPQILHETNLKRYEKILLSRAGMISGSQSSPERAENISLSVSHAAPVPVKEVAGVVRPLELALLSARMAARETFPKVRPDLAGGATLLETIRSGEKKAKEALGKLQEAGFKRLADGAVKESGARLAELHAALGTSNSPDYPKTREALDKIIRQLGKATLFLQAKALTNPKLSSVAPLLSHSQEEFKKALRLLKMPVQRPQASSVRHKNVGGLLRVKEQARGARMAETPKPAQEGSSGEKPKRYFLSKLKWVLLSIPLLLIGYLNYLSWERSGRPIITEMDPNYRIKQKDPKSKGARLAGVLQPLETPMRLVFTTHGGSDDLPEDTQELIQETKQMISKQLMDIEADRPVIVWMEAAAYATLSFSEFIDNLAARTQLPAAYLIQGFTSETLSPEILQPLKESYEQALENLNFEMGMDVHAREAVDFIKQQSPKRKVIVRFEKAPFSSFLDFMKFMYWQDFSNQVAAQGGVEHALKLRKIAAVYLDRNALARDTAFAAQIKSDPAVPKDAAHIVLRGAYHIKYLAQELNAVGVKNQQEGTPKFMDGNPLTTYSFQSISRGGQFNLDDPLPPHEREILIRDIIFSKSHTWHALKKTALSRAAYCSLHAAVNSLPVEKLDEWVSQVASRPVISPSISMSDLNSLSNSLAEKTWLWLSRLLSIQAVVEKPIQIKQGNKDPLKAERPFVNQVIQMIFEQKLSADDFKIALERLATPQATWSDIPALRDIIAHEIPTQISGQALTVYQNLFNEIIATVLMSTFTYTRADGSLRSEIRTLTRYDRGQATFLVPMIKKIAEEKERQGQGRAKVLEVGFSVGVEPANMARALGETAGKVSWTGFDYMTDCWLVADNPVQPALEGIFDDKGGLQWVRKRLPNGSYVSAKVGADNFNRISDADVDWLKSQYSQGRRVSFKRYVEGYLDEARSLLGPDTQFSSQDITQDFTLTGEKADFAFLSNVYMHLPENLRGQAFANVARNVKTGGLVVALASGIQSKSSASGQVQGLGSALYETYVIEERKEAGKTVRVARLVEKHHRKEEFGRLYRVGLLRGFPFGGDPEQLFRSVESEMQYVESYLPAVARNLPSWDLGDEIPIDGQVPLPVMTAEHIQVHRLMESVREKSPTPELSSQDALKFLTRIEELLKRDPSIKDFDTYLEIIRYRRNEVTRQISPSVASQTVVHPQPEIISNRDELLARINEPQDTARPSAQKLKKDFGRDLRHLSSSAIEIQAKSDNAGVWVGEALKDQDERIYLVKVRAGKPVTIEVLPTTWWHRKPDAYVNIDEIKLVLRLDISSRGRVFESLAALQGKVAEVLRKNGYSLSDEEYRQYQAASGARLAAPKALEALQTTVTEQISKKASELNAMNDSPDTQKLSEEDTVFYQWILSDVDDALSFYQAHEDIGLLKKVLSSLLDRLNVLSSKLLIQQRFGFGDGLKARQQITVEIGHKAVRELDESLTEVLSVDKPGAGARLADKKYVASDDLLQQIVNGLAQIREHDLKTWQPPVIYSENVPKISLGPTVKHVSELLDEAIREINKAIPLKPLDLEERSQAIERAVQALSRAAAADGPIQLLLNDIKPHLRVDIKSTTGAMILRKIQRDLSRLDGTVNQSITAAEAENLGARLADETPRQKIKKFINRSLTDDQWETLIKDAAARGVKGINKFFQKLKQLEKSQAAVIFEILKEEKKAKTSQPSTSDLEAKLFNHLKLLHNIWPQLKQELLTSNLFDEKQLESYEDKLVHFMEEKKFRLQKVGDIAVRSRPSTGEIYFDPVTLSQMDDLEITSSLAHELIHLTPDHVRFAALHDSIWKSLPEVLSPPVLRDKNVRKKVMEMVFLRLRMEIDAETVQNLTRKVLGMQQIKQQMKKLTQASPEKTPLRELYEWTSVIIDDHDDLDYRVVIDGQLRFTLLPIFKSVVFMIYLHENPEPMYRGAEEGIWNRTILWTTKLYEQHDSRLRLTEHQKAASYRPVKLPGSAPVTLGARLAVVDQLVRLPADLKGYPSPDNVRKALGMHTDEIAGRESLIRELQDHRDYVEIRNKYGRFMRRTLEDNSHSSVKEKQSILKSYEEERDNDLRGIQYSRRVADVSGGDLGVVRKAVEMLHRQILQLDFDLIYPALSNMENRTEENVDEYVRMKGTVNVNGVKQSIVVSNFREMIPVEQSTGYDFRAMTFSDEVHLKAIRQVLGLGTPHGARMAHVSVHAARVLYLPAHSWTRPATRFVVDIPDPIFLAGANVIQNGQEPPTLTVNFRTSFQIPDTHEYFEEIEDLLEAKSSGARMADQWLPGGSHGTEAVRPDKLVRLLENGKGEKPMVVVELGSGAGLQAEWIHNQGFHVLGLDFKPKFVARASKRASAQSLEMVQSDSAAGVLKVFKEKESPSLAYYLADFVKGIPLPAASVDAVVLHRTLGLMPDAATRKVFLDEISRILKPGGLMSYLDFSPAGPTAEDFEAHRKHYESNIAIAEELLKEQVLPPAEADNLRLILGNPEAKPVFALRGGTAAFLAVHTSGNDIQKLFEDRRFTVIASQSARYPVPEPVDAGYTQLYLSGFVARKEDVPSGARMAADEKIGYTAAIGPLRDLLRRAEEEIAAAGSRLAQNNGRLPTEWLELTAVLAVHPELLEEMEENADLFEQTMDPHLADKSVKNMFLNAFPKLYLELRKISSGVSSNGLSGNGTHRITSKEAEKRLKKVLGRLESVLENQSPSLSPAFRRRLQKVIYEPQTIRLSILARAEEYWSEWGEDLRSVPRQMPARIRAAYESDPKAVVEAIAFLARRLLKRPFTKTAAYYFTVTDSEARRIRMIKPSRITNEERLFLEHIRQQASKNLLTVLRSLDRGVYASLVTHPDVKKFIERQENDNGARLAATRRSSASPAVREPAGSRLAKFEVVGEGHSVLSKDLSGEEAVLGALEALKEYIRNRPEKDEHRLLLRVTPKDAAEREAWISFGLRPLSWERILAEHLRVNPPDMDEIKPALDKTSGEVIAVIVPMALTSLPGLEEFSSLRIVAKDPDVKLESVGKKFQRALAGVRNRPKKAEFKEDLLSEIIRLLSEGKLTESSLAGKETLGIFDDLARKEFLLSTGLDTSEKVNRILLSERGVVEIYVAEKEKEERGQAERLEEARRKGLAEAEDLKRRQFEEDRKDLAAVLEKEVNQMQVRLTAYLDEESQKASTPLSTERKESFAWSIGDLSSLTSQMVSAIFTLQSGRSRAEAETKIKKRLVGYEEALKNEFLDAVQPLSSSKDSPKRRLRNTRSINLRFPPSAEFLFPSSPASPEKHQTPSLPVVHTTYVSATTVQHPAYGIVEHIAEARYQEGLGRGKDFVDAMKLRQEKDKMTKSFSEERPASEERERLNKELGTFKGRILANLNEVYGHWSTQSVEDGLRVLSYLPWHGRLMEPMEADIIANVLIWGSPPKGVLMRLGENVSGHLVTATRLIAVANRIFPNPASLPPGEISRLNSFLAHHAIVAALWNSVVSESHVYRSNFVTPTSSKALDKHLIEERKVDLTPSLAALLKPHLERMREDLFGIVKHYAAADNEALKKMFADSLRNIDYLLLDIREGKIDNYFRHKFFFFLDVMAATVEESITRQWFSAKGAAYYHPSEKKIESLMDNTRLLLGTLRGSEVTFERVGRYFGASGARLATKRGESVQNRALSDESASGGLAVQDTVLAGIREIKDAYASDRRLFSSKKVIHAYKDGVRRIYYHPIGEDDYYEILTTQSHFVVAYSNSTRKAQLVHLEEFQRKEGRIPYSRVEDLLKDQERKIRYLIYLAKNPPLSTGVFLEAIDAQIDINAAHAIAKTKDPDKSYEVYKRLRQDGLDNVSAYYIAVTKDPDKSYEVYNGLIQHGVSKSIAYGLAGSKDPDQAKNIYLSSLTEGMEKMEVFKKALNETSFGARLAASADESASGGPAVRVDSLKNLVSGMESKIRVGKIRLKEPELIQKAEGIISDLARASEYLRKIKPKEKAKNIPNEDRQRYDTLASLLHQVSVGLRNLHDETHDDSYGEWAAMAGAAQAWIDILLNLGIAANHMASAGEPLAKFARSDVGAAAAVQDQLVNLVNRLESDAPIDVLEFREAVRAQADGVKDLTARLDLELSTGDITVDKSRGLRSILNLAFHAGNSLGTASWILSTAFELPDEQGARLADNTRKKEVESFFNDDGSRLDALVRLVAEGFVSHFNGNRHNLGDARQHALLNIWKNRESIVDFLVNGEGKDRDPKTHLSGIIGNRLKDYLGKLNNKSEKAIRPLTDLKMKNKKADAQKEEEVALGQLAVSRDGNPSDSAIARESGILRAILEASLPERQHAIYSLRVEERLTFDDIARKLNMNPNTVRSDFMKARDSMREGFDEQHAKPRQRAIYEFVKRMENDKTLTSRQIQALRGMMTGWPVERVAIEMGMPQNRINEDFRQAILNPMMRAIIAKDPLVWKELLQVIKNNREVYSKTHANTASRAGARMAEGVIARGIKAEREALHGFMIYTSEKLSGHLFALSLDREPSIFELRADRKDGKTKLTLLLEGQPFETIEDLAGARLAWRQNHDKKAQEDLAKKGQDFLVKKAAQRTHSLLGPEAVTGTKKGIVQIDLPKYAAKLTKEEFGEFLEGLFEWIKSHRDAGVYFSGREGLKEVYQKDFDGYFSSLGSERLDGTKPGFVTGVYPAERIIVELTPRSDMAVARREANEIGVSLDGLENGELPNLIAGLYLSQIIAGIYADNATPDLKVPTDPEDVAKLLSALQKRDIPKIIQVLSQNNSVHPSVKTLHEVMAGIDRNPEHIMLITLKPILKFLDDRIRALRMMFEVERAA